jgi:Uma2 family endonuclease
MTLQHELITAEEFEEYALLPENRARNLELIGGEIVEMVSNDYSSGIAMFIGAKVLLFVLEHKLGRVTTADGGYYIGKDRYIPDVAYISTAKKPEWTREAYSSIPPDLVVEVLSPSNDASEMRIKIVNYLRAGVTVWIVDPDKQQVEVYAPNEDPIPLGIEGVIDGGKALPGFRLPVKDIFSI